VIEKRIKAAVAQSTTSLVELFGVGSVLAAKVLGEVGDIGRFPTKHHYAAHTGTTPLEASSGQVVRHRLSRAGDRQLNHALYMIATVQIRHPTAGQGVLPAQAGRGQVGQGSAAVLEAAAVGCRLPVFAGRPARPAVPGDRQRLLVALNLQDTAVDLPTPGATAVAAGAAHLHQVNHQDARVRLDAHGWAVLTARR
jgi:hypothetical protein